MAAERVVTCLSILLLFAALALISFAQASQDVIPADSNHKSKTVPSGKGLLNGGAEHDVIATAGTNQKWLRGRKMVQMEKVLKNVKVSGATGLGGSTPKCGSNSNSNSNPGCEQVTVNLSDVAGDHRSGFVAFNADYHAPRHHPPKNN